MAVFQHSVECKCGKCWRYEGAKEMTLQEDIELAVKRARASFRADYNRGRNVDEDAMIAQAAICVVERRLSDFVSSAAISARGGEDYYQALCEENAVMRAWNAVKEGSHEL